jgi:energy-coupling factor transporter ATP-binding protein EcfA2
MAMQIKKAVRQRRKLRVAIDGPSGSGKTKSLLRLAFALVQKGLGRKVLVIDTENGSAELYAGDDSDGVPMDFDTVTLSKNFAPSEYIAAMEMGFKAGYDVVVVDSLSHAWIGEGGALDMVDAKASGGNSFAAWKDVTPMHRRMVDAIINAPAHMLVSMRTKTEWVLVDEVNKHGKTVKVPKRLGTATVQRDGTEYEFDCWARMDIQHQIHIEKTRCDFMDGAKAVKPGLAFWSPLLDWLNGAAADQVAQVVVRDERTPVERERDEFAQQVRVADREKLTQLVATLKTKGYDEATKAPIVAAYKARVAELDTAEKAAAAPVPVEGLAAFDTAEPALPGDMLPEDEQ